MAGAVIERLTHPGPVAAKRFCALPVRAEPLTLILPAGVPLLGALADTGLRAAWLELADVPMARLDHLRPGPDPTGEHAAWYDGPHRADGAVMTRLGLHLGRRGGEPWLHGHGGWQGARGAGGGHVLPGATVLAEPARARGWALEGAILEVTPDPETRFDLFQPVPDATVKDPDAVLLTLRPNQEITLAVEAAAAAHGIRNGTVHGLGSLVAPRLTMGAEASIATEILITDGQIVNGHAALSALVVGFGGRITLAGLERGHCGVCVTCEILIRRADPCC